MGFFGNLANARARVRDTQDQQAAQAASHEDQVRQRVLQMALQIRGQNATQANADATRKFSEGRAAASDSQTAIANRLAELREKLAERQFGESERHNRAMEAKEAKGGANGLPSDGERKAGAQLDLAQSADDVINSIDHRPGIMESAIARLPFVGNAASKENLQRMNQADDQLAMAYLRVTSGATVTKDEIENTKKTFSKQPGDTPALALQKRVARQKMIMAIRSQAGRAVPQNAPQPTAHPKQAHGPGGNIDLGKPTTKKTPAQILAEYGIN